MVGLDLGNMTVCKENSNLNCTELWDSAYNLLWDFPYNLKPDPVFSFEVCGILLTKIYNFQYHSFLAEKLAVLKQFWIKEEERRATDKVKLGQGLEIYRR